MPRSTWGGKGGGGVQARREKHKIKNGGCGGGVQHGDAVTALGAGYADQNKHDEY